MKLATIVLNYKTAEMSLKATEVALKEMEPIASSRLIIVDNDSKDGSFETMSQQAEARGWTKNGKVTVVQTGHNGGFGYGNNYGMRLAISGEDPADYLYLLNSDAFPDPGCITTLVKFLDDNPHAGIAGSYVHGVDGRPHETAFRFPTIQGEIVSNARLKVMDRLFEEFIVPIMPIPTETTQVDWLAGASMMLRRQVLEQVGMFDETFFLYFEETDLCRRAKMAGWPTFYVPSAAVAHVGSASTGFQDHQKPRSRWWFDSRSHYLRKNYGEAYLWASNVLWVATVAGWKVRRALQGKPEQDPPRFLQDFVKYNFLDKLRPAKKG